MKSRLLSDILILLIIPAPLTAILLLMGLVYLIAFPDTLDFGKSAEPIAQIQPTSTLSEQAIAIATFNALPVYAARPANISSGEAVEVAAALGYDDATVAAGQQDYLSVCAACHGTDGRGISGLGKDLIDSTFVHGLSDPDLVAFIVEGRTIWDEANTTGVAMPARGGNPGLTDDDILGIVAYLRVSSGQTTVVAAASTDTTTTDTTPAETTETDAEFTPVDPSALLAGAGVTAPEFAVVEFTPFTSADISNLLASLGINLPDPLPQSERTGEEIYNALCGLGYDNEAYVYQRPPNFCDNILVGLENGELEDDSLTELLQIGRPIWAEENFANTHVPPRGGYPPLTDLEIADFIAYLHQAMESTD